MLNPKVSVIIPTYNRANYIMLAINSVINQSFGDYEIIVVDDGSTDDTKNILSPIMHKIKYYYQENSGVSHARNIGIKMSVGEYITFLDSDDEWCSNYLSRIVPLMENYNINAIHSDYFLNEYSNNIETGFKIRKINKLFTTNNFIVVKRPLVTVLKYGISILQGTIVKKSVLEMVGLFNKNMSIGEDFDMLCRISTCGPIGILNEPLVNLYRRQETIVNLSQQYHDNEIDNRISELSVYDKLIKENIISFKEKIYINKVVASNYRAIGNIYIGKGEEKEARSYFLKSFKQQPSAIALLKIVLSFLPIRLNMVFLHVLRKVKNII